MLIGRNEKGRETSNYLPGLPASVAGFTILEILLITILLVLIISAFISVLRVGEFSNIYSGAKIELQQEVRRAMDTLVNDLRQTSRTKLSVENSTADRIYFVELANDEVFYNPLFVKCIGYNGSDIIWSPNQIGYIYNAAGDVITRNDSNTTQTWQFNNISGFQLKKIGLNLLSLNVTGHNNIRGNTNVTFSLDSEVRLRNE